MEIEIFIEQHAPDLQQKDTTLLLKGQEIMYQTSISNTLQIFNIKQALNKN